ncbi:hypothetical protein BJX76DRAFT_338789 [Aspergillus varians]
MQNQSPGPGPSSRATDSSPLNSKVSISTKEQKHQEAKAQLSQRSTPGKRKERKNN